MLLCTRTTSLIAPAVSRIHSQLLLTCLLCSVQALLLLHISHSRTALAMLTRVSCRSGRIATAATAAALRSRIAAAPLALRALHHASAALNTINQSSNVRTAGPMRVEQWMQKRLEDVKHEQESAASRPTVFASEAAFINELDRVREHKADKPSLS